MKPLFCSFYAGPGYTEEARGLVESLERLDLPHYVAELPDAGSWVENCGRKASFLLGVAEKFPGTPLVWLDADARVVQPPTMFDTLDCDVAFHRRHGEELLSGTLYFGGTNSAAELLRCWQDECRAHPNEWDQRCLDAVVMRGRWRECLLPPQYVAIFDDAKMMNGAVVVHGQASRRLRR